MGDSGGETASTNICRCPWYALRLSLRWDASMDTDYPHLVFPVALFILVFRETVPSESASSFTRLTHNFRESCNPRPAIPCNRGRSYMALARRMH